MTPRDRTVLSWIGRVRILPTSDISAFFFDGRLKIAQRRLKALTDGGYLSFLHRPLPSGKVERLYYLNRNKRKEINALLTDEHAYYWQAPRHFLFIEHQLKLNQFILSLDASCEDPFSFQFCIEHEGRILLQKWFKYLDIERKLRADAMLVIEKGARKSLFFVEQDMGTTTVFSKRKGRRDIVRKIRAYKHYLNAGRFQQIDPALSGFRVLFITSGPERLRHIAKACDERIGNLRGILWLTTTKQVNSQVLFKTIWHVPGSSELRAIAKRGKV